MGVVKIEPPVRTKPPTKEAKELRAAVASLSKGEFVSNGETYPNRESARLAAGKHLRMLGEAASSFRSKTWEAEKGAFVFGITPR